MKIGLYGGTFSPPHNGHRMIAEEFVRQCELDLLLIMPASVPPHKAIKSDDDPEMRLEMARLAFSDVQNAVVSRLELDRVGKSYTFDTLTALNALYGLDPSENRISMLCGTDMFLTLDKWYRGEEIFGLADIVYAPRGDAGESEKLAEKAGFYESAYGAHVKKLDIVPYPISSSEIREMLTSEKDVREHISENVLALIRKKGLYGTDKFSERALSVLREAVSRHMSEKRYAHTLAVEKEAAYIAGYVCPEKKDALRAAALLHDVAKELSSEKQLNYIKDFDIMKRRAEDVPQSVRHAAAAPGAVYGNFPEYATDEILSAVCYHTTGRYGMTLFDTVIFLADYTEETRRHGTCRRCRDFLHSGLDASRGRNEALRVVASSALMSLDDTLAHVKEKGAELDPLTNEAKRFFVEGNLPL